MKGGVTPSRVVTAVPPGGVVTSVGGGGRPTGAVAHAAMRAERESAPSAFRLGARPRANEDGALEVMTRPANPETNAPDPMGRRSASPPLEAGLYVVATPIGNLRDVTLRALDVLAAADRVYAEDTRVTRKLLDAYALKPRLASYHEHSAERARDEILAALDAGERVALVSDAGTPLISDPGYKLVRAVVDAGHKVVPIPGPSAALAALVASGLPTDQFFFAGFAPPKRAARLAWLAPLSDLEATLVIYETGPRLAESLADMAEALGDRPAVVARELTKLFEEVRRAPLTDLAAHYAQTPPKGEIVVLVAGAPPPPPADDAEIDAFLRASLGNGVREAAAAAAERFGIARKIAYARALALKDAP